MDQMIIFYGELEKSEDCTDLKSVWLSKPSIPARFFGAKTAYFLSCYDLWA